MKRKEKKPKLFPRFYAPGVIRVLFKDQAKIQMKRTSLRSKKRYNLVAKNAGDLKALNDVLTKLDCSMVSRIFTNSTDREYDALHKKARQKHPTVPNLKNFFTIHFPPTWDPTEVAGEFKKQRFVEKAYPVSEAVPGGFPGGPERPRPVDCKYILVVSPCRFIRIVATPCPGKTPLNEPLVGNRDTLYIVDPVRNLENQWYIFRCNVDSAWALACGEGVVVADIDWGFLTTHEDLRNKFDLAHAYNSASGTNTVDGEPQPVMRLHGTRIAGLIGAESNGAGMVGVAYGSKIWPIQAWTGTEPWIFHDPFAHAIDWVRAQVTKARKVITISAVTRSAENPRLCAPIEIEPAINAAIISAMADGVVVCVPAGNGDRDAGIDFDGNPIPFTGSIVVAATAYDPTTNPREQDSNWGARVDVAAPGDPDHDLSCGGSADDEYGVSDCGRTCAASAKVAGTVALMLQCNPDLTPEEVRNIIKATASSNVSTEPDKPIGGFLDAYAAVKEACRRGEPCRDSLIVGPCRRIRVVDSCEQKRIVSACSKTNILLNPCHGRIVDDGCAYSRLVIGPCGTGLVAGDPFWRSEVFTNWDEALENLRSETLKHFKRLTSTK